MSRRARWLVTFLSLVVLAGVGAFFYAYRGTRFHRDEYVTLVAISMGAMAISALVGTWEYLLAWRRFWRVEKGEVILARLRKRLDLRPFDGFLYGESQGMKIRLESIAKARIDVRIDGCGPVELVAQRRTLLRKEDHVTGDPDFDAAVRVGGDEGLCRAGLDRETRAQFLDALSHVEDLRIEAGTLRGSFEVGAGGDAEGIVRLLLALAKRLARIDPVTRLAGSATGDPHAEVRLRCLQTLCASHATSPECKRAIEHALDDPDPSVRLVAASRAGEAGFSVLESIARGRLLPEELRREAFRECLRVLPPDRARVLVNEMLGDPVEDIARMARELVKRAGAQGGGLSVAEDAPAAGAVSVPVEAGALEISGGGPPDARGRKTPA